VAEPFSTLSREALCISQNLEHAVFVQLNSLPSVRVTMQLSEEEVILPNAMQSTEILCGHKFNT
jgi:hypothetical protein